MNKKNRKHSTQKRASCATPKVSSKKKSAAAIKSKKSSLFHKSHSRKPSPSCWHEIDDDELEQELEENQKDEKKLEKSPRRKQ